MAITQVGRVDLRTFRPPRGHRIPAAASQSELGACLLSGLPSLPASGSLLETFSPVTYFGSEMRKSMSLINFFKDTVIL